MKFYHSQLYRNYSPIIDSLLISSIKYKRKTSQQNKNHYYQTLLSYPKRYAGNILNLFTHPPLISSISNTPKEDVTISIKAPLLAFHVQSKTWRRPFPSPNSLVNIRINGPFNENLPTTWKFLNNLNILFILSFSRIKIYINSTNYSSTFITFFLKKKLKHERNIDLYYLRFRTQLR